MTRLNRSFLAACGWMTVPVLAISSLVCVACAAEKPAAANPAEAAIRATADAFVQAFNRGDAKAVAALWTAEGSVLDDRGATIKGRKAIEGQYAALFKAYPGATMEVTVSSVEFPAPSVALENGVARVIHRDGPPVASRYTAIHVLEGGKWLMANVRETAVPLASGPGRLEALSWLIGSWTAKTEGVTVQTTFRWIANKSFIQRDYSVQQKGAAAMSGTQIIGWDPQENRLRSWTFDSSGGHGRAFGRPGRTAGSSSPAACSQMALQPRRGSFSSVCTAKTASSAGGPLIEESARRRCRISARSSSTGSSKSGDPSADDGDTSLFPIPTRKGIRT